MHAEKMVLHTDAEGRLIEHPRLLPNARLEAIYLIEMSEPATEQAETPPSTAEVARRLQLSEGELLSQWAHERLGDR
ncbi:hypothetical protein [Halochromatium roseum]|uniref:hypothetical protein n=1 Tax=Halochromatium roseum TaxID=391920 RepID=UPI0019123D4E|nr:hypothetical protein [Halochromatium roseum]MBK5938215.1 hypothetical protein [Halochromatium roseum]